MLHITSGEPEPLHCPLSDSVRDASDSRIWQSFEILQEARRSGDVGILLSRKAKIEEWLEDDDEGPPREGGVSKHAGLQAALGGILSRIARWTGSIELHAEAVRLVSAFQNRVRSNRPPDDGETLRRADLHLGNTLTRQAYVTHDEATFGQARILLEEPIRLRLDGSFVTRDAASFRDLGDALIGELHWKREVAMDGKSITVLRMAVQLFRDHFRKTPRESLHDEVNASLSSLATACAMTARRLHLGESTYIDAAFGGRSKDDAIQGLVKSSLKRSRIVWDAYLARIQSDYKPCFRWVRSVSNIAFAALYCHLIDQENAEAGSLAETAFLSVTKLCGIERYCGYQRIFPALDSDHLALDGGVQYSEKDHRYRWLVNVDGLNTLMKAVQNG